jgi:uncharacterized protein YraI
MALPKLSILSSKPTIGGWPMVFILGLALALVALVDRGGIEPATSGCELRVSVAQLNVRSGPSQQAAQVQALAQGATVDGTTTVTNGFRQLKDGNWVFDQYVTPIAGSTCG